MSDLRASDLVEGQAGKCALCGYEDGASAHCCACKAAAHSCAPSSPSPKPPDIDESRWCPSEYATATQAWESCEVPDHCAGCGATYAAHVLEPSAPKPEMLEKAEALARQILAPVLRNVHTVSMPVGVAAQMSVRAVADQILTVLRASEAKVAEAVRAERELQTKARRGAMFAMERARPLCPDHRDKQRGEECLACKVESAEAAVAEAEHEAQWQEERAVKAEASVESLRKERDEEMGKLRDLLGAARAAASVLRDDRDHWKITADAHAKMLMTAQDIAKTHEDVDVLVERLIREKEAAREEGVASVICVRCVRHYRVPPLNQNEVSGGECPICALIEENHEWAQWFEKWKATVDTYTSLLEAARAEATKAVHDERERLHAMLEECYADMDPEESFELSQKVGAELSECVTCRSIWTVPQPPSQEGAEKPPTEEPTSPPFEFPTATQPCSYCGRPYGSPFGGSQEITGTREYWTHVKCWTPPSPAEEPRRFPACARCGYKFMCNCPSPSPEHGGDKS